MTEHKPRRPRDPNQLAKSIVELATSEGRDQIQETKPVGNKQALGGKKRAEVLGPRDRSEIARKAAIARWAKAKQNHS